jgi:prophage DNA circulation protein
LRRRAPRINEFPTRDEPFTEDLGRRIRQYRVRGHVVGPLWEATRYVLISACEDSDQVGTLVHPYLGPLRVRCIDFEVSEDKDQGLNDAPHPLFMPLSGRALAI